MITEKLKTIKIILPDGNPSSIKITQFTDELISAVLFPRDKLTEAKQYLPKNENGIYFLFQEGEDRNLDDNNENQKPIVYIGEGSCIDRINKHLKEKDFWDKAVIFSSLNKNESLTKSDIQFLEFLCIKKAIEIGRYNTDNIQIPAEPILSHSDKADRHRNFETIKVLLSTLGFPIFKENSKSKNEDILTCKREGIVAHGFMIDDGFVVKKDSQVFKPQVKSSFFDNLKENDVIIERNDGFVFAKDHPFKTPSTAAKAILGREANGWIEWKNKDGKTIDEIHRKDSST